MARFFEKLPIVAAFFQRNTRAILLRVAILTVVIAVADWRVDAEVPLGFLYLLPMAMIGTVLGRLPITLIALAFTLTAENFDSFVWSWHTGVPRDVLYYAAFCGVGMVVYEITANRRAAATHLQKVEDEIQARREAEEQLQILIESSPIAILTVDSIGTVLLANDASHRLFGVPPGTLPGMSIERFLPTLAGVSTVRSGGNFFRTMMQCRGRREDGEIFLSDVWFSTYKTRSGSRLTAMVVDTSEDLRDREESGLHQLLSGSRILVGAVSHEIRNICAAIAVVHENLTRDGALARNKDFEALGTLVHALENVASMELRQSRNRASSLDLKTFFEELRIVVGPSLRENEIELQWDISPHLPHVWADRQSLMQVFLNLVKNSEQAMRNSPRRQLVVQSYEEEHRVTIWVRDSGSGVKHSEMLFKPFQPKANVTGLGLYLSRALMRSFRGDLRYEPTGKGACFVVELALYKEITNDDYDREN